MLQFITINETGTGINIKYITVSFCDMRVDGLIPYISHGFRTETPRLCFSAHPHCVASISTVFMLDTTTDTLALCLERQN